MNVNHRSSKIQVVLDSNCNFYMHRIFIMNSEYIKKYIILMFIQMHVNFGQ